MMGPRARRPKGERGRRPRMAEAVTARWHGDNYQARIFWENALNLLDRHSCVVEVTFEANGPQAFDDVVVSMIRPSPGSGPERVSADYQQVKWHVAAGGPFGYEDLHRSQTLSARSRFSLLQRLQQARLTAPPAAFHVPDHRAGHRGRRSASPPDLESRPTPADRKGSSTAPRTGAGWARVRKLWRAHFSLPTTRR